MGRVEGLAQALGETPGEAQCGLWLLRVHSSPCYEWKPPQREHPWGKAQPDNAVAAESSTVLTHCRHSIQVSLRRINKC